MSKRKSVAAAADAVVVSWAPPSLQNLCESVLLKWRQVSAPPRHCGHWAQSCTGREEEEADPPGQPRSCSALWDSSGVLGDNFFMLTSHWLSMTGSRQLSTQNIIKWLRRNLAFVTARHNLGQKFETSNSAQITAMDQGKVRKN